MATKKAANLKRLHVCVDRNIPYEQKIKAAEVEVKHNPANAPKALSPRADGSLRRDLHRQPVEADANGPCDFGGESEQQRQPGPLRRQYRWKSSGMGIQFIF